MKPRTAGVGDSDMHDQAGDRRYFVEDGFRPLTGWKSVILVGGTARDLVRRAAELPEGVLKGAWVTDPSADLDAVDDLPRACQAAVRIIPSEGSTGALLSQLAVVGRPGVGVRLAGLGGLQPEKAIDLVKAATSLGCPVFLEHDVLSGAGRDWLLAVTDYYLYSPGLRTPVEPLHSVMAAEAGRPRAPDLWDVLCEKVTRDVWVDSGGRLSLGPRWAARGRFFGHASEPPEIWRASPFHEEMSLLRRHLLLSDSACFRCAAFPGCAGYLAAMGETVDCSGWIAAAAELHRRAIEIKKLLAKERRQRSPAFAGRAESGVRSPRSAPAPAPAPAAPADSRPTVLTIFIADTCVNNCVFCAPADRALGRRMDSHEQILDCLDSLAGTEVRAVTFSGAGEPTLNPKLGMYLERVRDAGIAMRCVFTNGHGATREGIARLVDQGMNQVLLSIHGMREGHEASVRRKGSFDEAMEALRLYLAAGVEVNVNSCLTRRNLSEIATLIATVAGSGTLRHHSLANPEWSGNALASREVLATLPELEELFRTLDLSSFPHVILDNVPDCAAGPHRERLSRPCGVVLYRSRKELLEQSLNLGHNTYPSMCRELGCREQGRCAGIDRNYIEYHGTKDIHALARRFTRAGLGA